MLSFFEARARIIAQATVLGAERVRLDQALGRVLAEPLHATACIPAFDYSAMDGYAIDEAGLDGAGPWSLPVKGECRTGHPTPVLYAGSACRIFTGAELPQGANAVMMQENVVREGDSITFSQRPSALENVRQKGEDLTVGDEALTAGTCLTAFHLGLVAALDHAAVNVRRRPRVSIVCTGDELRAPGSDARAGSIPESNSAMIAALCGQAGAVASVLANVGDDLSVTIGQLQSALEDCDLLVTVGGVSVGDHDVVKPALEAAGADLDFWKVKIKPGKPVVFGHAGDVKILGLPGNPVSAGVTFVLFGLPLLRAMQGVVEADLPVVKAQLLSDLRQKPGRMGFYRAQLSSSGVTPLAGQASGSVTSLAWANAFVVLPEDSLGALSGSQVDVVRFSDL